MCSQDEQNSLPPYIFPLTVGDDITIITFDPNVEEPWPELSNIFNNYKVSVPFLFSHPDYQIEPLFRLICKKHSVPSIVGPVRNMPLTQLILQSVKPDTLISQADLVEALISELLSKNKETTFKTVFLFGYESYVDTTALSKLVPNTQIIYQKHPLI